MTADAVLLLSVFIREPQFQGQTKEKLVNPEVPRLVENAVRDHVDHYLTGDPEGANTLLELALERLEDRQRRKAEKDVKRKPPTRKLRLPGKLADCSRSGSRRHRDFPGRGRFAPAARPNRRANAKPRRSCRCAARS